MGAGLASLVRGQDGTGRKLQDKTITIIIRQKNKWGVTVTRAKLARGKYSFSESK